MIAISSFTIPPAETAPRVARHRAADACRIVDPRLVEDVTLLVSELVTNAVVHGRGHIELEIDAEPDHVWVAVSDQDPAPLPTEPHMPDAVATGGRGLAIVSTLARRWGVIPAPDGKTVWFECGLPA